MTHQPARTPCLGARVSALADGSLRSDVRDRALAHTLTCPSCRQALEVERLTVERLRSLPDPEPSPALMAMLYAMAEPGGPVPARRGFGPGMPRPLLVPVGPVGGPPSMVAPVRPGGSTHPANRAAGRRMRRSVVVVAAGALGVGAVAVGVLTSTVGVGVGVAASGSPAAQLTVQSPASSSEAGSTSRPASERRASAPFGQSSFASRNVALTSPFATSASLTPSFPGSSFPGSSFPGSSFPAPAPTAPRSTASAFRAASFSTPTLGLSTGEFIAHGPRLSH